jgi:hypothetical protein
MLRRYPKLARIRDVSGRLPLEIALENGYGWYTGANELVKAFPESLSTPETSSGLFPFLFAATVESTDDEEEDDIGPPPHKKRRKKIDGSSSHNIILQPKKVVVETTFQLLRECPDLIKVAIID